MIHRFCPLLLAALVAVFMNPQLAGADACGNGRVNQGEFCDDGNNVSKDGCSATCFLEFGWQCTGTNPSVCTLQEFCGNGVVENDEECDDANLTANDGCQADCQVQTGYTCTGEPSVCVPPGSTPVGECGDGVVDEGEDCDDGDEADNDGCESDCTVTPGYQCSGEPSVCSNTTGDCGNGQVDIGEACDGGACCVGCQFATSTRVCRAAVGGCDAAESCSGASAECPADAMRASNSICRASSGVCDAAERCDGTSTTCPANALSPSTTVCRPAVSTACDVAEFCTGATTTCPEDQLLGCPDVDGLDCVHPACDPSGECTTSDECVEVCREPRFWATRATTGGNRQSALDLVLDEAGPIQVCGETIDSGDDVGDIGAAIEGLCVATQGNEQRELYRALLATTLNCLVSEGGTCEEILSRFADVSLEDCDALCAGQAVPGGPTIDECIDQLECFNKGGQVVDGGCATGTCASDPGELCGGDFDSCSEEECIDFDDSCAGARLCQASDAEVRLCGHKLVPRNQKVCREARRNQCTIDDCE